MLLHSVRLRKNPANTFCLIFLKNRGIGESWTFIYNNISEYSFFTEIMAAQTDGIRRFAAVTQNTFRSPERSAKG